MTDPRPVLRHMLIRPIDIQVSRKGLDFNRAKKIADRKAREVVDEPALLAWFDKKTGRHMPNIAYGCQEKPSWLLYAQHRGAVVSVNINNEDYIFIYKEQRNYP